MGDGVKPFRYCVTFEKQVRSDIRSCWNWIWARLHDRA